MRTEVEHWCWKILSIFHAGSKLEEGRRKYNILFLWKSWPAYFFLYIHSNLTFSFLWRKIRKQNSGLAMHTFIQSGLASQTFRQSESPFTVRTATLGKETKLERTSHNGTRHHAEIVLSFQKSFATQTLINNDNVVFSHAQDYSIQTRRIKTWIIINYAWINRQS